MSERANPEATPPIPELEYRRDDSGRHVSHNCQHGKVCCIVLFSGKPSQAVNVGTEHASVHPTPGEVNAKLTVGACPVLRALKRSRDHSRAGKNLLLPEVDALATDNA